MRRILFGLLALAIMGLPAGCKRSKDPVVPTTLPSYQALSVTFDNDGPPPETDPSKLLFRALLYREVVQAKELLQKHPNLVNQKINNTYPVLLACESRSLPLVKTVVEAKADLTVRNPDEFGAIWIAATVDSVEVVKYLVAQGMDPKAPQTSFKETLLWAADSRAMAVYLISVGVDPEARDKNGDTALHEACRRSRLEVIRVLLEKGLKVDTRGRWNMTPLHSAASTMDGDPRPVVELLLSSGADVNVKGFDGRTALHECAFYNRLEMASFLLANGAVVEPRDNKNQTPMDLAVAAGRQERALLVNLLIRHGAPGQLIPVKPVSEK